MKHVFVIHSNITYLSALGVILKENIAEEDAIILSREYQREKPVKCHLIKLAGVKSLFKKPHRVFNQVKYIDEDIEKLVNGEEYICYVECLFTVHSIIATHRLCKGINFIEEGSSVYARTVNFELQTASYGITTPYRYKHFKERLADIFSIIRGFRLKVHAIPSFYNAYFNTKGIKFYTFSENAYYGVEHKVKINLEDVASGFEWDTTLDLENKDIWLGTPIVSWDIYGLEPYISTIEKYVVPEVLRRNKEISIKFHPGETSESRDATIDVFKRNGIKVSVIDDAVVMEIELFKSNKCRIFSVDTSIMIYATKVGVECFSIADRMPDYHKSDFTEMWKNVKML